MAFGLRLTALRSYPQHLDSSIACSAATSSSWEYKILVCLYLYFRGSYFASAMM